MTATVFIVEDNPSLRNVLARLLEIAGLKTAVYADGNIFCRIVNRKVQVAY